MREQAVPDLPAKVTSKQADTHMEACTHCDITLKVRMDGDNSETKRAVWTMRYIG